MSRVLIIVVAVVVLVVAAAGYGYYSIVVAANTPVEHSRASDFITIDKGTAPREIISKLAAEGIIENESYAQIYLRLIGDASKLQAGEFQFPSPITLDQVLKQLERGEERTIRITIPEGFTRFDIAKRLANRLPNKQSEAEILAILADTSLIRDIAPQAKDLEGFLYPSTYNVPRDATAADVIKMLVEQFRKFWKPEWSAAASAMGKTPFQIVTIASLIETETSVESERPVVAGVIYNRLSQNMALGIDQTVVYVAKMENRWDGTIHKSDIDADSPYNTRKYRGLPPGPISSVTESSIRAALQPDKNNYIFYVLNVEANDGSHHFYASSAEFEKGKARYQTWLEEQRKLKRANETQPE